MTQTIQKMEEKLKGLAKENLEMVSTELHLNHMCVFVFIGPAADVVVTFLYVCVAEGEDQLSSATEEAEVFEWPGSGARWTGSSLSEASGPGAAKHHRWTDQSKYFLLIINFHHIHLVFLLISHSTNINSTVKNNFATLAKLCNQAKHTVSSSHIDFKRSVLARVWPKVLFLWFQSLM